MRKKYDIVIRGDAWEIIVTDKMPKRYCNHDDRGVTIFDKKKIYINSKDREDIYTWIHELQHGCIWDLDEDAVGATEETMRNILSQFFDTKWKGD